MKKTILVLLAVMLTTISFAKGKKNMKLSMPEVQQVNLATGADSASYAIGMFTGIQVISVNSEVEGVDMQLFPAAFANAKPAKIVTGNYKLMFGNALNEELFMAGFNNILLGDTSILSQAISEEFLEDYGRRMMEQTSQKNLEEGERFLAENKTKEGVVTLPSGLQYKILVEGDGEIPTSTDIVKMNYMGKLLDGTVFNNSKENGEPVVFGVTNVVDGLTEALQLMPVGSKWEIYVPSELAFGYRGVDSTIGPNETLIFEIELLSIEKQ